MKHARAVGALVLGLSVILAACGGGGTSAGPSGGASSALVVVTTSAVFADMVRNVGGDRVTVTSLVPKGADVHTYQATPDDLRAAARAALFVMNGLGLDDWLGSMIKASGSGAPIVKLGVDLPGVALLEGDEPGTRNPHLWMDVAASALYAARISEALQRADPAHATAIAATAAAYQAQLTALDAWVRERIATVPADRRKIVTFHPALPYFARAYGLTVVGVAVKAPGQDPSAGEIAALVDAIRASGASAIFAEAQFPTALIDQIASETGAKVVATLYDDSLGNAPVTSYDAMIRWDVEQIVAALK